MIALCIAVAVAAATAGLVLSPAGAGLRAWLQPVSAAGGPFTLVDQHGDTVRDTDLAGRPMAVAFGYTSCPDVCPTTLQDMAAWRTALGADAQAMSFVFVTLDPIRDTPEILRTYVGHFDAAIVALTGTAEEIDAMARAYKVFVRKAGQDGGDILIDHTAATYLMGATGHYRTMITYGETHEAAMRKLRALIEGS
jgi:protein SCO1/2